MSEATIPAGLRDIVLRCYLLDDMVTVESCHDSAIGRSWIQAAYGKFEIIGSKYTVHIVFPKGSEKITQKIAKQIAVRWMKGQYIQVDLTEDQNWEDGTDL